MAPRCVRTLAWKEAIMRRSGLLLLVSAFLIAPAAAQQIRFLPDFSNNGQFLQLNNSQVAQYGDSAVLRLTPPFKQYPMGSSAYFILPQPMKMGFFTYFSFQMHDTQGCCSPGDGFAFIVQNSTATDFSQGAIGSGLTAVGAGEGGIGYSGINNSLAVEFDIYDNQWDPNSNHVAIQSCGGLTSLFNSPVHEPGTYTIGNNHNVTSCLLGPGAINYDLPTLLGPMCNGDICNDGLVHQVVIEYTPPTGEQPGSLQVYLDPPFQPGSHVPVSGTPPTLNVPYNLIYTTANPLGLVPTNTGNFLVGFTGSLEGNATTIDILSWEFTPQAPSQITQPIAMGGTLTDFAFGGHQLGVTYPNGFSNMCNPQGMDCFYMTVTATPVNQQQFYINRLMGTNFANENCIIYLQTGGNCIDYSVTCTFNGQPATCPQEEQDDDIAICSQFETPEPVSSINTDFLEADPIGSNNWCSIWTGFQQQDNPDPIVSGKGPGFSDIVATLSPTGPGMPMCDMMGGDLKQLTKRIERTTSSRLLTRPPQGGFCPPIMSPVEKQTRVPQEGSRFVR